MMITVRTSLTLFALLCTLHCAPSQATMERAAEGAYLAEHLRCVESHDTNAAINACRDEVRRRWGITTTTRDAGGDR